MIVKLSIQGEQVDLFKDEAIIIDSSVAKIKDITKVYTDVSNVFNIPASDKNNKILKYVHKPNLVNNFDPRIRLNALIELSGEDYKFGKVQYVNTKIKSGKPTSHELIFVGNLTSIKDILGNDKLSDIDFSTYDFEYTYINALDRLRGEENNIVASLFSKKRLVYDSGKTQAETDTQTNIYYDGPNTTGGVKYNELIYSIKCKAIIDLISSQYGIVFSDDFLGSYEFSELFLMMNNSNGNNFTSQVEIDVSSDPTVVGNTLLATPDSTKQLICYFESDSANDVDFVLTVYNGSELIHNKEYTYTSGSPSLTINIIEYSIPNTNLSNVTFFLDLGSSAATVSYEFIMQRFYGVGQFDFYVSTRNLALDVPDFKPSLNMPDMSLLEFLTGIFKTYKLVAIAQDDGVLYVDNLQEYYRKGDVVNINEWVDASNITVSYGKVIKEIDYTFSEPQTKLASRFNKLNNKSYGDNILKITGENGEEISGETEDYSVPFEQVVYERLTDFAGVKENVNIQYGLLADESIEPIVTKAHIHFNNVIQAQNNPLKLINVTDASPINVVNIPSHTLGFDEPLFSTVIGEEFNEFNGQLINNTIYSNHHQSYIEGITGEDKREYNATIKNLPLEVLNNLQLNDVLNIKDNYYRIDNFKTNLLTKETKMKLFLTKSVDLDPTQSVSADSTLITADNAIITADQI